MKKVVISLGGSLIVPKEVDTKFISSFKKTLRKNYRNYKFIVVCGGGHVARKYISILKSEKKSNKEISLAGIRATRMNARLMMQVFGKEANDSIPLSMKDVEDYLPKNKVVFCGALRYASNETSDGTAAKLAHHLKSNFINLTNVPGLFTSNPLKNKKAKLIQNISWKDFEKKALRLKFKPGQHFVLDQNASTIIRKSRIKTYILGPDMKNFDKLLKGKKFKGTTIQD